MTKLRIVRRGHFWALLENGRGLDAYPTKTEAYMEKKFLAFTERKRLERERMTDIGNTERLAWKRMPIDEQIDQLEHIRQMYVAN